jgi:hypothetical protein
MASEQRYDSSFEQFEEQLNTACGLLSDFTEPSTTEASPYGLQDDDLTDFHPDLSLLVDSNPFSMKFFQQPDVITLLPQFDDFPAPQPFNSSAQDFTSPLNLPFLGARPLHFNAGCVSEEHLDFETFVDTAGLPDVDLGGSEPPQLSTTATGEEVQSGVPAVPQHGPINVSFFF